MKIVITNLNVGSGIEYVGNKIVRWVKEVCQDVYEYKQQTCVSHFIDELIKYQPDIIIVNELFPRIIQPIYYYKKFNPKTRVFFVVHSWMDLIEKPLDEITHIQDRMIGLFCKDTCDRIMCLSKNRGGQYIYGFAHKLIELYMPVSADEYKIITPWRDRKKLFLQLGNLLEVRLAQEFIDKVKNTNLSIDCYGEDTKGRVKGIKNLVVYPRIKQEDMPKVLNEYKYLVVPHDGQEVFFIALLQAIMCGTIPLVMNDRNSKAFDPNWINWANGLYFGVNDADKFIINLETAAEDVKDFTGLSTLISQVATQRFEEKVIKQEIIDFINK